MIAWSTKYLLWFWALWSFVVQLYSRFLILQIKNNICDIWFSRVQWGMLQSVASTLTYPTYHDGTRESTCAWQTMACCHLLTRPLMLKFTVSSAILCYSRYAVYNFHHTVYRAALLWQQKMNTRVLVSNHKKTKFKKVNFRNFKIF